jgi:hypothetical protein
MRPFFTPSLVACAALLVAFSTGAVAPASEGPSAAVHASASPSPKGDAGAADDGDAAGGPAPAAYATFVKDAEVKDGLFPLIRKDGKVYLTLTTAQLDHDFYEHATTANGLGGFGVLAGDDFEQPARIVRFVRVDDKHVALVLPQVRLQGDPGTPVANAVRDSTADSVQAVAPVAAVDKSDGKIAIDASFLLGDSLDLGNELSDLVEDPKNPLGGYHIDPGRTYFGPIKAFPENVIVEADETFESAKASGAIDTVVDPRTIQMRVTYNFAEVLSSPDYRPRLADDRVGYWIDPHLGFSSDDSYDNLERYAVRWNLRASDPTKPSPAVKPIVYTLTNTIPLSYRPAIRDALLEWNKAFARIGILDAVQVQDQPDDPNWDSDDIRYNPVRWLTEANGGGFAEAQIEWDPRTGEIFRSGILIDADIMRYGKFYYQDIAGPASGTPTSAANPRSPLGHGFLHRDYGARAEAQFGMLAMSLLGEEVPSSYSYDFLKSIVLHEAGHDFGLAHNFIAHQAYTAAELRSKSFTARNGVSSSVMAYDPVNLWPKGTSGGAYFSTTLGPYDYHVIHWGYAPIPGAQTPADEVPTLDRWAQAATDPKYAFASDEDVQFDGHAVDPRVAQFILTGDGVSWCETQMQLDHKLIATLDARFPRPQMPWDQERAAFGLLLRPYTRCAQSMTHYIAGEYLSRARRGDPRAPQPLTPVPRGDEQRAFEDLDRYLFSDQAWALSPVTLRRLVYSEYEPMTDFGYDPSARHDISLAALVGAQQAQALAYMFAPLVLERLADLPSKSVSYHTMSLADLFSWTQQSVFGDLGRSEPLRSSLHHNLQRTYARILERISLGDDGSPYDAQALAHYELLALQAELRRNLLARNLDLETRAHLTSLADEVRRSLDVKDVHPTGV